MDQKEFYCNYIMPKVNALKNSFPYFASTENQTLYVMVPTLYPMVFNQKSENVGNIANCLPEEEVLPDFRCKICSATIFNYFDFKIHMRDSHEKVMDEVSKKHLHFEDDGIRRLENENKKLKLDPSENIVKDTMFDKPDHGYLGTANKRVNFLPKNNELPVEAASNKLLEGPKSLLTLNTIPLSNIEELSCSKSEEPLDMQNEKFDSEFKKSAVPKLPLIQNLNKFDGHTSRNILSNHTEGVLQPVNDKLSNISVPDSGNMNSPLNKKLILHKVSREGNLQERNNIPIAEPSTSTTALILTHTGLKELFTMYNKKVNTFAFKPNFTYSSSQSLSVEKNTKSSSEIRKFNLDGAIPDRFSVKKIHPTTDKVNDSLCKSRQLKDLRNSDCSTQTKNEIFVEDNARNKTAEYAKIIIGKNSHLESLGMNECSTHISKSVTNDKEKSFQGKEKFETHYQITNNLSQLQKSKIIGCVLCNSSFSSISTLRKHLAMFHCGNKNRRQCPHCNYTCFQTSDLLKHIARRHTGDFKYKCLSCTKGFTTPSELKKHKERKHFKQKSNE